MKVTVGAKELKKRKLASPSPGGTRALSPTRHRAYRLQERHKEGPSWSPCLKNLLEAGKYTRHSAGYEFWLVIDGMIVFIFTSCVWMPKFSKPTSRSVNVKRLGAGDQT